MRSPATVLDYAAGSGRHARYACSLGQIVTAIDIDQGGLDQLSDLPVERILADIEADEWWFAASGAPERQFDVVICTNYLYRPRLAALFGLVAAGGWMIYETFADGNQRFGRPRNPDFLLQPGELLDHALNQRFAVLGYEHGLLSGTDGAPRAMVQRLCARRAEPASAYDVSLG